jgi:hypothetical protein
VVVVVLFAEEKKPHSNVSSESYPARDIIISVNGTKG